jgi:hypothetical protein
MSFFYELNKKLDAIRETPSKTHGQLNERDEGKPGKNFAKIAADAAERYGSKAAGERVAGAVRNKLKAQGKLEEEGMSRAAKGYEKYGKQGMEALAKAGREGKALDPIRKKYDKYNNTEVDEGVMDTVKSVGKKVAGGINKLVGHGSDEEMIKDLQRKSGAPVTGKKPTFADKIANAKKEVDEMLGDVAAEAIKTALSPKQKKIDLNKNGKLDANDFAMLRKGAKNDMEEGSKDNAFTAHKRPSADQPKVGSVERGSKHDIKHTATGRMVTRRTDDQGISVGADDDSETSGEKRGRGRPKGTKQSIGAKGPSGKSKLMTKEGDVDVTDQGEYDQEGDMAKDDIKTIVRHAQALEKILGDNDNLPEWVQAKLAKIEGMMTAVDDYMQNQEGNDGEEEPIAEKAVSKQQQKFMGMAHAMQKGEKIPGASKELKKVAKTMKKKDVEDFAKTKHKGLPDKAPKKKKEEEVEESSTTSGSVATSTATPKGGGGMSFGKGIYDSMNFELEQMIAESMQNEDAPRSWQRAADKVGTIGGAALGGAGGAAAGALIGTSVFGPLGIAAAAPGGLAGLTGGAAFGSKLAKSAVNTAHDASVGLYRKISSMLGGPEGTIAFAKAHISAAASGRDSFEFGGKNYNVTMSKNEAQQLEDNQNTNYNRGQYDQLGYRIRRGVPLNRGLTRESMSINMSDSTEGNKSLTVTATDDDAMKLAMMLKSAGLGGQGRELQSDHMHSHDEEACDTCGMTDCGCGDVQEAVDENAPDWPTNTETSDDALQYAGGLNKPKTDVAGDGQTTVPNTAVHTQDEDALRRMMEMAGLAEAAKPDFLDMDKDGDKEESMKDAVKDKEEDSVDESIQRMREMAGIKEAKKPDYLDFDKDGDKKEPMTKALKDKEEKKVDESIFALTNQWRAYKG